MYHRTLIITYTNSKSDPLDDVQLSYYWLPQSFVRLAHRSYKLLSKRGEGGS